MKIWCAALTIPTVLLASCGQASTPEQRSKDSTQTATSAAMPITPARSGAMPIVVLQLTELQLLDADLLDASGKDIGDIEMVWRGADGQPTGLLVEVEGTAPKRYVNVPLNGLKPVRKGADWDVGSSLSREDLLKLPEAGPLPVVALGLTEMQILDADLVNNAGQELGDVTVLLRGPDNMPSGLLVEADGLGPDRYVEVPLKGLKAVRDRDGWNIVSPLSRDDLGKLPTVVP